MPSSPLTEIGPDFRDMLGQLLKHSVEFLLIGGHAMGVHNRPRYTDDMDFLIRPSPENALRMWKALAEFGMPMSHLKPGDFTRPTQVVQFGLPPNRIDFTMSIEGVTFEEAWRDRLLVDFAGMKVPVLSKEHLIRNKSAVGRDKDLLDVAALLAAPAPAKPRRRLTPHKPRKPAR
jgi:hypothetical protein